jgi:Ca2+-binding EF-hand superfamily protein
MSKELGWSTKEEKRQIHETIGYLVGSMGLQLRGYGGDEKEEEEKRVKEVEKEVLKRVWEVRREREPESPSGVLGYLSGGLFALGSLFTPSFWRRSPSSSSPSPSLSSSSPSSLSATFSPQTQQHEIRLYGRARFQPSEITALRHAFSEHADSQTHKVSPKEIVKIVKGPEMKGYGYGEVTEGDLEYVLEEMRISISRDKVADAVEEQQRQQEGGGVDFEEFIEICGNLKDVGVTPSTVLKKERKRIPVEKSGGGV